MAQKKLKPKIPGSIVRDENRIPLPDEGRDVTITEFWERRLREEDVVEVEAPKGITMPATKAIKAEEKGGVQ